jgi:hypothetical protein
MAMVKQPGGRLGSGPMERMAVGFGVTDCGDRRDAAAADSSGSGVEPFAPSVDRVNADRANENDA